MDKSDNLLTFIEKYNNIKKLYLSKENNFIIYENSKLLLEYIDTIYIGAPDVYSSIADVTLAGRDVQKIIKYRTEGRDFNIVFYYINGKYMFSHIKFSNFEYRLLK